MAAIAICVFLTILASVNSLENPRFRRDADSEKLTALTEYIFNGANANGDGLVTQDEFVSGFMRLDTDGDGEVSEAEYVAHMTSPNFPVQMAATVEGRSAIAKKIFSIGDSDGNGQATTAEATAVFQAMDADGNGELTRQEHHLAWAERRRQHQGSS